MRSLPLFAASLLCWSVAARVLAAADAAEPAVVKVGAGSYLSALPPGAKGPPAAKYVTADFKGPVPTNDWCSSLFFEQWGNPHFAHPLAMKATPAGLRVFYPGPNINGTKDAIFAGMPGGKNDKADLTIGHSAVEAFDEKRVAGWSDSFVNVQWDKGNSKMTLTYGHGSPIVYGYIGDGGPRFTFAEEPKVWAGDAKSSDIGLTVGGKHYGLFRLYAGRWNGLGGKELTAEPETKSSTFAVAVLPDNTAETLALFAKHAAGNAVYPVRSTASWSFDAAKSEVTTKFDFDLSGESRPPEPVAGVLLALYPHQWRYADGVTFTGHSYRSVRGDMRLALVKNPGLRVRRDAGTLATKVPFPGVLPALPRVPNGADPARVAALLKKDMAADDLKAVKDTYWDGKMLGKWASLIPIAEQYGLEAEAAELTSRAKARLEDWMTATDADGKPKAKRVFAYEKNWGTLIGYPASFGSDVELNDHHFHYGYFLRAAGEIARRDPAWAADDKWGGMIKLIARDVASTDANDKLFPRLRNTDPYAGHSWASGHARFGDGNNNESSSEAMNAWYGLILLGQHTGDTKMRDLGVWLYTTEMTAIEDYWFGVHGDTFAKGYTASVVTMVWGGKGANGTWFSAAPEAVHGINFLPITGGHLYLGRFPDYAKKNWDAMIAELKGKEPKQWLDVLLMYRALSDPADALARFDAVAGTLKPEAGNSLAGTYHWIATLNAIGQFDRTVTADHPLAATFVKDGKRTHVAYRGKNDPAGVTFSDGTKVEVAKEGFGVK